MQRFVCLLAAASLAGVAAAADPEVGPPLGVGGDVSERRVICTPFGCRQLPRASWTWVAAFGATVVAAGWLGRRARSARA